MNLEQLFPEKPEFFISSTNKTYVLRIPNLEDRARFSDIIGQDKEKISEIFTKPHWDVISRLVYRIMKDKSDFLAGVESIIDDDGHETSMMISGPTKLLRSTNMAEGLKMIGALAIAMRAGDPLVDAAMKQAEIEDAKKKTSTLAKSSISSQTNTATLQGNSQGLQ